MAEPKADAAADSQPPYWNYLFKANKCPTDQLDRLLRGLAVCISGAFEPHDCHDLTPTQLAAFYRRVGGDYDPLFLETPNTSIAYIYKSLGCLHSLQPERNAAYAAPCVPALKPQGFVTWQTIQLLLGPEEHAPFIQKALQLFEVKDPDSGAVFPKNLPRDAFPMHPDEKMILWHEGVSEKLRIEAQKEMAQEQQSRIDHVPVRPRQKRGVSTESLDARLTSGDERADAANYFSNPFYRNREGRPAIVRNLSKAPTYVLQGGKAVAISARNTVKNMMDPHLWSGSPQHETVHNGRRRKSAADVDPRDEPPSPASSSQLRHGLHPQSHSRTSSGHQTRPYRLDHEPERMSSHARGSARSTPRDERPPRKTRQNWSSTDSESGRDEDVGSPSRLSGRSREYRAVPRPDRRHRSQEPTAKGYFDDWARSPRPFDHRQAAFQPPQASPTSPLPQRSYSQRHLERRSPPAGRPNRSSTEGEYRGPDRDGHHATSSMEGSRNGQAVPHGRSGQIPYYGPRSGAPPGLHRTRDELRSSGNASPRPRFAEAPNLHPHDAELSAGSGAYHRRRGSTQSTTSPASGAEEHDSERRDERPHRRREGEGTRQGTPVQGVSGRRYATAEVPWQLER